jgi:hypothetical protein
MNIENTQDKIGPLTSSYNLNSADERQLSLSVLPFPTVDDEVLDLSIGLL